LTAKNGYFVESKIMSTGVKKIRIFYSLHELLLV